MAVVTVPRERIVTAQVIGAAPPIAPTRMSLGVVVAANVHAPPARFVERPIVARAVPWGPPYNQ
jgi:hypothetical protein